MSKNVLYVLFQKNYFSQGMRGRVSHAKGFAKGLSENNHHVTILSGPGAENHIDFDRNANLSYKAINSLFFFRVMLFMIKGRGDYDLIVCRWKPLYALLFTIVRLFFKIEVVFEVNSITSLSWKGAIKRFLAFLDLRALINRHKLILVSESLIQQICMSLRIEHCNADYTVIPNGYDEKVFKQLDINLCKKSTFNLVYFGTKQNYYDWDLLYSCIDKLAKFNQLLLFGFTENRENGNVQYFGRYSADELGQKLSLIKNPILILHSKDCDIARNGSPMKMFEYLALGVPMIISDVLYEKLGKTNGAVPYQAGNYDSLLQAYSLVVENYEELLSKARAGSICASEQYSWRAVTKNV